MKDKTSSKGPEKTPLHCPLCGRELSSFNLDKKGWDCQCGEFIPAGLHIDPFQGCTHGLSCNCGRERKG